MAKAAAAKKNTALYIGIGAVVVAVIGGMFYMMMQKQTTTTVTQPATGTQTGTAVFVPGKGFQIASGIFDGIDTVSNTALDWLKEFRGNTGGSNPAQTNG